VNQTLDESIVNEEQEGQGTTGKKRQPLLRNPADVRTLAYMAVATGLFVVNWMRPLEWSLLTVGLWVLAMFMAVSCSVMAHNHNHLRTFNSPKLNVLMDWWLTVFYGFPVFAWVPTHNMNHHKFTNKEGDYTITYRLSEANNALTLLSYPTVSGSYQTIAIRKYLAALWERNRTGFWLAMAQIAIFLASNIIPLIIDWQKALIYVIAPQQFAVYTVMIFNYVQHVHADEESKWNHSRNITGWGMNALLFNNGFHTVHHNNPGLHWSLAPAEHAKIADKIDPALNEKSFFGYMFRTYVGGAFSSRFGTRSMRLARKQA
jgi:beta-carotene hydroxylase